MSSPAASSHVATSTGHGTWHPTSSTEGSDFVFIDSNPAIHVGHTFAVHTKSGKNPSPHVPTVSQGSSFVNIDGNPMSRIGDSMDCGDAIATGSDFVFVGD